MQIYDFSNTHPDFSDSSDATFSKPTYMASPYGAWLAASTNPSADTFSYWFRDTSGVNQYFTNNITLVYYSSTASNR